MKLRRILLLLLVCCFAVNLSYAEIDEGDSPEEIKAHLQTLAAMFLPFFENLQTCTYYKGQYTQVFGKKNGQCHFRIDRYECIVPPEISKQYAKQGYDVMQAIKDMDVQKIKTLEVQKDNYKQVEADILDNYCTRKYVE